MALIDAASAALKASVAAVPTDALPNSSAVAGDASAYGDRRDPWDVVLVAGRKLPGRAEVGGKGVSHQIDIKKVPGTAGSTFTDLGRELARFDIKLHLWSDAQWIEFQQIRSLLQPKKPDGKLDPVDVQHPGINGIGVRSLYVTRVGMPDIGRHERGVVVVDIECLEYAATPATNVTKTPKRSIESVPHGGPAYPSTSPAEAVRPSTTHTGP
jgi:hypothetical protein